MNTPLSILGRTNAHGQNKRFGLKPADRLFHEYVIGQTGTGKSTLLANQATQDMAAGHGLALIDPHGDLAEAVVTQMPEALRQKLYYLNAADLAQPYSYNPLAGVRPDLVPLVASGLIEAFKMLFPDAWGVRMEHIFRNGLYALIEAGGCHLPDLLRLLSDPRFRAGILKRVKNPQVLSFWQGEFRDYQPRYRQEAIAPIQNKVGAFLADPRLHRLFTGDGEALRLRRTMDEGAILVVNLSRGVLGPDSAQLLGALLVTTLSLAALSRADTPDAERRPFFLYIDEFQTFTTRSVASMVAELRKYRVGLILANQHLGQLTDEVRHAVLGNVGTLISFRTGPEDAQLLSREFGSIFGPEDLMNLPNYDMYLRVMIEGAPSRPFSATTEPPSHK